MWAITLVSKPRLNKISMDVLTPATVEYSRDGAYLSTNMILKLILIGRGRGTRAYAQTMNHMTVRLLA